VRTCGKSRRRERWKMEIKERGRERGDCEMKREVGRREEGEIE
jgi:hypothetical protein